MYITLTRAHSVHNIIITVTAPSPIDTQTLHYEVTFSTDITPILHINFTVSEKNCVRILTYVIVSI